MNRNKLTLEGSRTGWVWLGLFLAVCAVLPARAQFLDVITENRDGSFNAENVSGGAILVNLEVKDKPLNEVLDFLSQKSGVNIISDPNIEETITIRVVGLEWRKALALIVERANCVVEIVDDTLIKVTQPPRVTMQFKSAELKTVIDLIALKSGANIVVDDRVGGTVTLRLTNVPWQKALRTVVNTAGYTTVTEDYGIIRVVDPQSLQTQLETRVFRLRYVRIGDPYKAVIQTQYATGTAIADTEFPLRTALEKVLSNVTGTLDYDPNTNSFIVTSTPPVLDQVAKIIKAVDIEPYMIQVDSRFISTSNSNILSLGVNWNVQASMTLGSMTHKLPFNLGSGGFEDYIGFSDGPSSSDVPSSGLFTFGTLDMSGVRALLEMIKQDSKSRVVQSPSILTLNHHDATIFVGREIRYAETSAVSSQSGGTETSITESENSPVTTGFQLLVIPHVVPGTNKIIMTVIPQATSLITDASIGETSPIPGFIRFSSGTSTIDLPQVETKSVVTKMLLESGQTAVIGGLLDETETSSVRKVPFLGDIPILGWAFRNKRDLTTVNNLLVLITPRIIRAASDIESDIGNKYQLINETPLEEYKANLDTPAEEKLTSSTGGEVF